MCSFMFIHLWGYIKFILITKNIIIYKDSCRKKSGMNSCRLVGNETSGNVTVIMTLSENNDAKNLDCIGINANQVHNIFEESVETLPQSPNLPKHSKMHKKEIQYVCPVCSKHFKDSFRLKSHQVTHSNETPYSCSLCFKQFRRSSHLKRHQETHMTVKPHQCHLCEKRLASKASLKNHVRMHEERDIWCICDDSVLCSNSMKDSLVSCRVEDGTPDGCGICGGRFRVENEILLKKRAKHA